MECDDDSTKQQVLQDVNEQVVEFYMHLFVCTNMYSIVEWKIVEKIFIFDSRKQEDQ